MNTKSLSDTYKYCSEKTTSSDQSTALQHPCDNQVPDAVSSTSSNVPSAGASFRNSMLSRQPSFDHGGEGRLSSTQVKQRLKTYLLNRRKLAVTGGSAGTPVCGGRHRRTDDRFNSGSQFNTQVSEPSPSSIAPRGCSGFWDSNDSANSFDSDWNESMLSDPSYTRSFCKDRPDESTELSFPTDASLAQLTETSSACHFTTTNPNLLLQLRQQFVLSCAKALSDPAKSTTGTFRTDLRKTISEPDLFETSCPWPLRLFSHLIRQTANSQLGVGSDVRSWNDTHPTEHWNPNVQRGSIGSKHPTSTTVTESHWAKQENRMNTSTVQHGLNMMNPNLSRTMLLEPLMEPGPASNSSFGHHSVNLVDESRPTSIISSSTQTSLTPVAFDCSLKRSGLRAPLQSSTSMDSAFTKQTMVKSHEPFEGYTSESPLPVANQHESDMDWETACSGTSAEPPVQEDFTEFHDAQERIFELWYGLPVEDWFSSPSPALSALNNAQGSVKKPLPTAIAFDPEMLHHKCLCPSANDLSVHPESPTRVCAVLRQLIDSRVLIPPHLPFTSHDLSSIFQASLVADSQEFCRELHRYTTLDVQFWHTLLNRVPLIGFCRLIRARMATEEELRIFHSEDHILAYGRTSSNKRFSTQMDSNLSHGKLEPRSLVSGRRKSDTGAKLALSPRLCKLPCGGLGVDSDTVWNPSTTARASRLATGQVLCLAHKVANHELRNGFALIRPPGHHAEPDHAMGFCYFNSVAVAALHLLRNRLVSKLLVLDWDIHHGNGTKLATLHPGLVYISIHRHDDGTFFPGTGLVQDSLTGSCPIVEVDTSSREGSNAQPSAPSQLINIAWGAPTVDIAGGQVETMQPLKSDLLDASEEMHASNKSGTAVIDAEDRRQMWRQYYSRQKQPYHPDSRIVDNQSTDALGGSLFVESQDSDFHPPCLCRRGGSSGASSQACSICLSHPSSFGSLSTQSTGVNTTAPAFHRIFVDDSPKWLSQLQNEPQRTNQQPLLGLGDAEYLAAVRCVVLPVANEFKPDMILISAGFDAAYGHQEQLGGYCVSPGAFAWITRQCMSITNSRVVLALEGGYVPSVVGDCVTKCLNALLLPAPRAPWSPILNELPKHTILGSSTDPEGYMDAWLSASDWITYSELARPPRPEAVSNILATIKHQARQGWRCFAHVSEANVAMSFADAIEMEQTLLGPRTDSNSNLAEFANRPIELDGSMCNSPLTDGLAQLHMDRC